MKKIFTLAFAAMMLASCGKGDLKSQLLDQMKECKEAIEKAESEEDFKKAGKDFEAFMKEHKEELEASELEKDEEVKKGLSEIMTASFQKAFELQRK